MDKRCNNCKNRVNDPRWCQGCEYNFPGLDQFDFYQPILHSVLMVEKDGPAQAKYEKVAFCEHENRMIVLTLSNKETVYFPDDGSWLMFDYTPTCGWNENPGIIPEIHNKRQVKVTLVRQRPWENNSIWVDDLFLVIDAAKFDTKGMAYWENPKNVENELRRTVQGWLRTKVGWEANARSSLDFNWGDLITELPIEMLGVKLSGKAEDRMAINAAVSITVEQDELLAPDYVPAVLIRSDGTQFGTGTVNFRTGMIYSVTSDQVMPKFDEPILVRPEYSDEIGLIACWDAQELRYFLDK